jgi:hypothetical protein
VGAGILLRAARCARVRTAWLQAGGGAASALDRNSFGQADDLKDAVCLAGYSPEREAPPVGSRGDEPRVRALMPLLSMNVRSPRSSKTCKLPSDSTVSRSCLSTGALTRSSSPRTYRTTRSASRLIVTPRRSSTGKHSASAFRAVTALAAPAPGGGYSCVENLWSAPRERPASHRRREHSGGRTRAWVGGAPIIGWSASRSSTGRRGGDNWPPCRECGHRRDRAICESAGTRQYGGAGICH